MITLHSNETEMTVLGSLLNSQEALFSAIEMIHVDDFAEAQHQKIFQAIKQSFKERKTADILLVGELLKSRDCLNEIGGYGYLATLSQFAGTSAHIQAYFEDLRKLSLKRKLLKIHRSVAEDLQSEKDPYHILDRTEKKIQDLKASQPKQDSFFQFLLDPTSEEEIVKEVQNHSPGADVGFKIGEIDLLIPSSAITIIAGPTGHGKTAVLINFFLNYLELHPEKQSYFFTYEESKSSILSLFLNTYIDKPLSQNNRASIKSYFREGTLQYISEKSRSIFLKEKQEFFKDLIESRRLNIVYSEFAAEELVEAIHFIKKNTNVGLIGIDYMQLLSLSYKTGLQRQEELKKICLLLKNCAIDTGLPILLAAQFNRTVTIEADLSPTAIGEAGDIERVANLLIGIWNRNYERFSPEGNKTKNGAKVPKQPTMYVEILKGREVGIGHSSILEFNGNTGKISAQKKSEMINFS